MKLFTLLAICIMVYILQNAAFAVTVRDVTYSTRNAGKVVFRHADHINRKGLANDCRACHDDIFSLKQKKRFVMADMEKGKSCGACHDREKAFSLDECSRCHPTRDKTYNIAATGPTRFSHNTHLASSPDCRVCHPSLFVAGPNKRFTMAEMKKGKSCGACHNGSKAFGIDRCVTCHPVKEKTFKVKETGPTHFSHKIHIEISECVDCHPKLYAPNHKNRRVGMAAMEKGQSCGACHNSRKAFSIKECTKCHPVRQLQFEEKSAGNVVFSHLFHNGMYGCVECHTRFYKTTRSTVRVSMQEMETGKSCGGCHDGKTAFSVKEKCEACHKMQ
jgi:c(7)-type cytochrome triheme protein